MIRYLFPLALFASIAYAGEVQKEIDYSVYTEVRSSISSTIVHYFFIDSIERPNLKLQQRYKESVACYQKNSKLPKIASCFSLDYLISVREISVALMEEDPVLSNYFSPSNIGKRLVIQLERHYSQEEIRYIGALIYAITLSQYGETLGLYNSISETIN